MSLVSEKLVVNRINSLWNANGARTNKAPTRRQYLTKAKRSNDVILYMEFGVPRTVYTPEGIYDIQTIKQGNVKSFIEAMMGDTAFTMYSISPEYPLETPLDEICPQHSEMWIALR